MSEANKGAREWKFYIDDMLVFARKVQEYTRGFNQERFVSDSLVRDDIPPLVESLTALTRT